MFDGTEGAPQPAPVSASTVNVYSTPGVRPGMVHEMG